MAAAGHELQYTPELKAEGLAAAVVEFKPDVLVVRSTKVRAEVFDSKTLTLVIRAGAGVNTIDLATASERGVFVANCPGKNAIAVAELSMGLLLSLDRRIPDAVADLRAGRWEKKRYQGGRGLFGRRLGLIGFGNIAREFASRARAFGMEVWAWTPRLDAATCEAHQVRLAPDLDTLLGHSEVLSIHVPMSSSTRHMIGARELALLPEDAIVLHTARGGVIDDGALEAAVAAGRLRAGLDVLEDEPAGGSAEISSSLAARAEVYTTPHIGASTAQAASAIAAEVMAIIEDFAKRGVVRNCVNLKSESEAQHFVIVRHLDEVGVLAAVLHALRGAGFNVQEMQNLVFDGGRSAAATIRIEGAPTPELLTELEALEAVLGVSQGRSIGAADAP